MALGLAMASSPGRYFYSMFLELWRHIVVAGNLLIFQWPVAKALLPIRQDTCSRCRCGEHPSLVSPRLTDAGELLSMNTGSPPPATVLTSESSQRQHPSISLAQ